MPISKTGHPNPSHLKNVIASVHEEPFGESIPYLRFSERNPGIEKAVLVPTQHSEIMTQERAKSYLLAKETHNSITCITDRLQYYVLEKISQKIHRRYQPLPAIHPVIHHGAPLASPVATNAPAPNAKEPRPLQGGWINGCMG